ncbi:MAG: GAF domain-containing sensor histidine kinase [Chloroflexi bacterium]|nr:GAF domain-containing sensor histidine kinase [Chloroflexota bacterium]
MYTNLTSSRRKNNEFCQNGGLPMSIDAEEQRGTSLLARQIETFYQVNRFISSIYNEDELLGLIMQESETAVGAERSCIALYDPSDERLHITFATGDESEGVRGVSLAMGQGIIGEVAATNAPILVHDVRQDPRHESSVDQDTGFVTRSILATPIRRRDDLLGVLEVINKKDGTSFTEDDSRLLEVVANQAAIAIGNIRLVEQMLQSEQLSVIGRMAASIIHDLKKPMAVIRGFAELLANPDVDAEKRQMFSNMILEDVDRFLGMTQELLDYSRGQINLEFREIQLGEWVESVGLFLKEDFASAQVEMVYDLQHRGTVRMDPDRMRRVLVNIAGNAKDAMAGGGRLTIATRKSEQWWELEVADNGSGIPPDIRPRIFEPFVTSGKEDGTGLGLAIVREIVQGHGGTIGLDSRIAGEVDGKDPGTTFILRFPLDPAAASV